jgi:inorganic triphosphatase YgiF
MDRRENKAEIEIKLAIPSDALARLARDPRLKALASDGPRRKRLVTTYFDTPDRRLMAAELALRVRREGRRRIQTLKTASHPELGPLARGEWEREIVGERPVLDAAWLSEIDDKDARRLLAKAKIRARLEPLFSTDFRRQTWRVRRAGSVIELAIDKGTIEGPDGRAPISEVELELKSGDPGVLYGVAREIAEIVPAVVETRSKAERGYALGRPSRTGVRGLPFEIARDANVETAFRIVGRTCMAHARANETLVRESPSPEGVHQLRVALRRMRSALSAFRDVLPEEDRRRTTEDLRWIAASCGAARDWDVFRTQLLKPLARHVEHEPALTRVTRAADAARTRAYAAMRTTLESRRMTRSLLEIEEWWERGDWASAMGDWRSASVREFARLVLRRLHRKVMRLGSNLRELPEAELHELRIRCKKLRYAAEFFRGAFPKKSADAFLAALAGVQDHLGSLNDAVVARELLAELARSARGLPAPVLARAEGIVTGWIAARVRHDLEKLPDVWRAHAQARPFWK